MKFGLQTKNDELLLWTIRVTSKLVHLFAENEVLN